jgi:hypothetical protein
MLRLRIVLDFVADEATPRAKDELRGYLKAMVQYQRLEVGLGSRNLESLGYAGGRSAAVRALGPPAQRFTWRRSLSLLRLATSRQRRRLMRPRGKAVTGAVAFWRPLSRAAEHVGELAAHVLEGA